MAQAKALSRTRRRSTRALVRSLLYHGAVIALGSVMIYPLLWLFASSFKNTTEIWTQVTSLLPKHVTLTNYITGWAGFGGTTFTTFYRNSLIYAGVICIFSFMDCVFVSLLFWVVGL
jgi:multiple sugar transport system permease protein